MSRITDMFLMFTATTAVNVCFYWRAELMYCAQLTKSCISPKNNSNYVHARRTKHRKLYDSLTWIMYLQSWKANWTQVSDQIWLGLRTNHSVADFWLTINVGISKSHNGSVESQQLTWRPLFKGLRSANQPFKNTLESHQLPTIADWEKAKVCNRRE